MIRRNIRLMAMLALAHTAGFYVALMALMIVPVPTENRELVSMMLGHLSGFVAGVVTYHFGSSQESAEKNAAVANQAEALKVQAQSAAPAPPIPDVTIPEGGSVVVGTEEPRA